MVKTVRDYDLANMELFRPIYRGRGQGKVHKLWRKIRKIRSFSRSIEKEQQDTQSEKTAVETEKESEERKDTE